MGEAVPLRQQLQDASDYSNLVGVAHDEFHRAAASGDEIGEIFALYQFEPLAGGDGHFNLL